MRVIKALKGDDSVFNNLVCILSSLCWISYCYLIDIYMNVWLSYVCECFMHNIIMGDDFHVFLLYVFCGLYSIIIILDFLLLFDSIVTCIIRLCACNLLCACMCANRCMIELLLESM